MKKNNIKQEVITDFGKNWETYKQNRYIEKFNKPQFERYFKNFPWKKIKKHSKGFDAGCGTGRWAYFVAPKVGRLYCVDPSSAINVAKKNLNKFKNCFFYKKTLDEMPIKNNSMDFGYSLGVLHHIEDTEKALLDCVKKLKPKAPFLLYLYYLHDNKPKWYHFLWLIADTIFRKNISKLSFKKKYFFSNLIALFVYWPLSRFSLIMEKFGIKVDNFPLSFYRDKPFYVLKTDSLDKVGTKIEKRFTKKQINKMMKKCGLNKIIFNKNAPYWCAIGFKKN
ncbi:MAG: SAM-dependent methyltransferase [Candidatus Pelagibacter sp. TMED64]|nr:SAM-dependent methyltransferase [Candidatus Pelagibacter sp.]OUU66388.1 MAG: SAM-dependent methyltransferase [Candidatus Pelagibacter sp. TMED64]|tara:strand:+ start:13716 stop:14552 length:837 start_codon:yes stop_codon:yes gene_type:complete